MKRNYISMAFMFLLAIVLNALGVRDMLIIVSVITLGTSNIISALEERG